jgi:lipoate-protein ligase A
MASRITCHLLVDPPAAGAWNMAVDEALLDASAEDGTSCWRFYRWQEATLSLGYFQRYEDRQRHAASSACPVVRRASGGGAIVHDIELTYSLVASTGSPLARSPQQLYRMVHAALIESLAELGVSDASFFGDRPGSSAEVEPFLCFQRRSPGDVVSGDAKIAGSAQRRRRGAVLQHGSVLLGRSAAAPELPGINDLASLDVTCEALVGAWLPRLEEHLAMDFSPWSLSPAQRRRAEHWLKAKYASDQWTRTRGAQPS